MVLGMGLAKEVVVIEGDEPEFIGMIRKEDLPIVMGIISFLLTIQPWSIMLLWVIPYFTFIPGIIGLIAIVTGFHSLHKSEKINKKMISMQLF